MSKDYIISLTSYGSSLTFLQLCLQNVTDDWFVYFGSNEHLFGIQESVHTEHMS